MASRHQPHASASAPTHQLPSRSVTDPDKGDNHRGRIDTPHLTGLKEGANVSLLVSYDVGGTKKNGNTILNKTTVMYSKYDFGTDTKTGTINLLIGGGNAQAGAFAEIDWSKAPYFLRLGMKQKVETKYTEVSNTQMVSVPYALYAEKAGSVTNNGDRIKNDFILTCAGDGNDNITLFTILSGGTVKGYVGNTSGQIYTDAELNFTIIYQNGIDQQLTAEIEGATIDTEYSSKSTSYGRCYSFNFDYFPYPEKHPLTLVIKDKNKDVVASYPFFIQYNELYQPQN